MVSDTFGVNKLKVIYMSIIAFTSSKEAVGKTTSAIILATTLAQNCKVTLIDADPAGRLLEWAKLVRLPRRLKVRTIKGAFSVQNEICKAALASEFVIVDLGTAKTLSSTSIVAYSDLVIIPMNGDQEGVEAAHETLNQVRLDLHHIDRDVRVRILFARTHAEEKLQLESLATSMIPHQVKPFSIQLPETKAYACLQDNGGTLYSVDPRKIPGVFEATHNAELFAYEMFQNLPVRRFPQEGKSSISLSVRLSPDEWYQFQSLCMQERCSKSDMIEILVKSYSKV